MFMDMAHAGRALAQPWLVLSTQSIQSSESPESRSDREPTMIGRVSTRRMDQDKVLGAECTIMQLLDGTAALQESIFLTCSVHAYLAALT
jgi:hypothetical protein